eukprot:1572911-Rhodomonas_salina.2
MGWAGQLRAGPNVSSQLCARVGGGSVECLTQREIHPGVGGPQAGQAGREARGRGEGRTRDFPRYIQVGLDCSILRLMSRTERVLLVSGRRGLALTLRSAHHLGGLGKAAAPLTRSCSQGCGPDGAGGESRHWRHSDEGTEEARHCGPRDQYH